MKETNSVDSPRQGADGGDGEADCQSHRPGAECVDQRAGQRQHVREPSVPDTSASDCSEAETTVFDMAITGLLHNQ